MNASWKPKGIGIVGAGLIGASWAALFRQFGHDVRVYDPSEQVRQTVVGHIDRLTRQGDLRPGTVTVVRSLAEAVQGVELVQENAPESIPLKQELLEEIQALAPAAAIASSTSSLRHSDISGRCPAPERVVIAHPFNPPHIVPLVELFGTDPELVARMHSFYTGVGKRPIVLRREMTGHVANRLSSALWREALYLVQEGVVSAEDIDTAITAGPGLRWAVFGPFMTYHMGGGQGGIGQYLDHLGASQVRRWEDLGVPRMDKALRDRVVAEVLQATGDQDVNALVARRDRALTGLLETLERLAAAELPQATEKSRGE
jgi:carnitine 3-dehydrogenase